jgi:hypothetical protein
MSLSSFKPSQCFHLLNYVLKLRRIYGVSKTRIDKMLIRNTTASAGYSITLGKLQNLEAKQSLRVE